MSVPAIHLLNNPLSIDDINANKCNVFIWLIYTYSFHYIFLLILHLKRSEKSFMIQDLGRRIHITGIASIVSLNFVQYSFLFPVLAFVTFILMLISHVLVFIDEVKERVRIWVLAGYYTFAFVWLGTILFYYIYNMLQQ